MVKQNQLVVKKNRNLKRFNRVRAVCILLRLEIMKAKEAQKARFRTKNVVLDGAVEATLEDLRSVNP